MSDQVAEAIRARKQRLAELDRERAQLVTELESWREMIGDFPDRSARPHRRPGRRRPIRERSTVWWAQRVLKHASAAMPVDDLVKAVEELSGLNVRKSTLVSNLSRYVRAGDTFTRPEPGAYGLVDFQE